MNPLGDVKTEILIEGLNDRQRKSLINKIHKNKIDIISFRSNDLQSLYDKLINQAEQERIKEQKIDELVKEKEKEKEKEIAKNQKTKGQK